MPPYTYQFGEFVNFASVWTMNHLGSDYRKGKYFRVSINAICRGCGEKHMVEPFFMSCN